jgi:predicted permease
MRRFFARIAAFLLRGRAERELSREVASHLALMEDDFRRRGMSDAEARNAARRAYGGVDLAMEMQRDARSFVWLEQAVQDARHVVRSLRKSPAFVAVALLSLGLGIGVNTAIFTLVHGILLKQLPVPDPQRIVQIKAHFATFDGSAFSYPVFRELRKQREVFADVIAFHGGGATLVEGEARTPIAMELVSGSYFSFFGARPALGRLIEEADDAAGGRPVCVLSHATWQSRFGGDSRVLGRILLVNGVALEVVGVAPEGFTGPYLQRRNDLWTATAMQSELAKIPRDSATWIWLSLLGRLRPGVPMAEASARLAGASAGIEAALPKNRANKAALYVLRDASKGFDSWRTALHDPLMVLMGAVTLVLLVACANLANLLLARAGERQQEFAIKLSLGISRARLLRQLMGETFAITFAGGALGAALSVALTRYLLALFNSGSRSQTLEVAPDWPVLLYTFAGCAATAVLAGFYPAWQASRTDVARRLTGGSNLRRAWVRRGLILAQVTLAVVLLFGASLFAHSLRNLKTTALGIDIDRVLTLEVKDDTPGKTPRRVLASPVLADVLAQVRQAPGVESAAFSLPGPFTGQERSTEIDLPGPGGTTRHVDNVGVMFGTPGFLTTMRLPLLRGRDFTAADRGEASPVVLVNQRLASMLWPGEDPIGKRMPHWSKNDAEVVGVVGNSHYREVREAESPILYEPFDQQKVSGGVLLIRYRGSLGAVEREARAIVKAAAVGYVAGDAAPMALLRDGVISQDRLLAFLSSLFGALGTALALVGIYGLISYSVTRRTREVGIRVSIGAQRRDVLWLFARETVALLAVGVALGIPLAIGLARFVRAMLYNVSTSEPRDLAITLAVLAAGGLAASWIPGRRAMRIDPVRALRYD